MKSLIKQCVKGIMMAAPLLISSAAWSWDLVDDYLAISGSKPSIWFSDTTSGEPYWYLEVDRKIDEGFNIRWLSGETSRSPFKIEKGTRTNLLYLDSMNRIGINKANPNETLEIASDRPGIRLDDTTNGEGSADLEVSANRFVIRGNTPWEYAFFNADTRAPSGSFHIDDDGDIGLGIANPDYDLAIGGSSEVFFENGNNDWQINTGGFGFWFKHHGDAAFPPTDPVKFNNNAPSNSLVVEYDTGDIGLGLEHPQADLHVLGEGSGNNEELLRLDSTVPPRMKFNNSGAGTNWLVGMNSVDDLFMTANGTGKTEAKLIRNGNLVIAGNLTQNSDRDSKRAIKPVDRKEILAAVANLPISTWEYKGDTGVKHLGPMAQDFHAAFGLGDDPKGISSIDTGGVALAAIKGLNESLNEAVQAKDKEIESLKERLTMLENLVNKLTAKEVVMNQ